MDSDNPIYTAAMKDAVHSIPSVQNFVVDIVEINDFLAIRFYENNYRRLNDATLVKAAHYLVAVRDTLAAFGIDVTMNPVSGDPV